MKIFKFGGASIKDANSVKNVGDILKKLGYNDTLIVASAMGKMTNALEEVVRLYMNGGAWEESLQKVKDYHTQMMYGLFDNNQVKVFEIVSSRFEQLIYFLKVNKSPNFNFVYDQIVCYGELVSTIILSEYLNSQGVKNDWIDARDLIKTDSTYRDVVVNWEQTQAQISQCNTEDKLVITQGFIGSDENHFSVTLGREGSDYTAAIFAYCLNADSVTIWKDVDGVLNADPRYFQETKLLKQMSYEEAIEMAFYGASVIHPKTLQPLQEKKIPLYVRSFLDCSFVGTQVFSQAQLVPQTEIFIVKKNQILLSISTKDFSFIMEDNISDIFKLFGKYHIKVSVIQNSAISFSVCVEDKFDNFEKLLQELKSYTVDFKKDVWLYTIRHFEQKTIDQMFENKKILLKQVNRETIQVVVGEGI